MDYIKERGEILKSILKESLEFLLTSWSGGSKFLHKSEKGKRLSSNI